MAQHQRKKSCHAGSSYHQQAVIEACGIIEKFENPTNTVKTIMDENLKQRHQVYPKVEALAPVVQLLGKQRLALRVHRESSEDASHNQGNFLSLIHGITHYYPLLKNHLDDSLRKDVKYLGPKSQNELIDIIGKKLI